MFHLMCPPTYFDIEYSINPWMDVNNRVDSALAHRQWNDFVATLRELGDEVEVIPAAPGLPDMTFSGDVGLVFGKRFIPSNFRVKERVDEVGHYLPWFREHKFQITPMPADIHFEGLGDLVFHRNLAIVGHGCRSDERAIEELKRIIPGLRILGDVHIRDDHYFHVAMALSFIDEQTILYYPPAFSDPSVKLLERIVPHAIAVGDEDANEYFACNNLVLGKNVLIDNCTPKLRSALAERGYQARCCPMSEFKKSGGSLRCLVLSFLTPPEAA
jgi:N-dimethylarginine dimethylaminohydrolase